ncbi:LOW QUALITY PROTEIN: hypothetical protein V2J09_011009 [Rumex salicifolius]
MEERQMQIKGSDSFLGKKRPQRVKVRQCSKKHKEMSALYLSQDFQAHEGPILVMKLSPDGVFLASAGEDRIMRVWKVVVDERSNDVDIPDTNPLSLYFTLNHQLELQPFYAKKERTGKVKRWSRTSDSICVILPPKVFRFLEKPLCEFKGHRGEILDLSWSNMTCVQFKPIDDNYFISSSLDERCGFGKYLTVMFWLDIKDIVTTVSYRPDGQGCLKGSITGFCLFYTILGTTLTVDLDSMGMDLGLVLRRGDRLFYREGDGRLVCSAIAASKTPVQDSETSSHTGKIMNQICAEACLSV